MRGVKYFPELFLTGDDICGVSSTPQQILHPAPRNQSLTCWQLQKNPHFLPEMSQEKSEIPMEEWPWGLWSFKIFFSPSLPNFPPTTPSQTAQRALQNLCCHIFPQKTPNCQNFPLYEWYFWWRSREGFVSTCFLSVMSKHLVWMFLFSFDFCYSNVEVILLSTFIRRNVSILLK